MVSIVPIAFGYHFAHYLPSFLVDAQYALKALSDPFALGWNLLGMRDFHVTASFLTHHASVEAIWYAQVGVIVAAHVAAVVALHGLVGESREGRLASILSEIPLTVLMIGYTVFGLWLLSDPGRGVKRTRHGGPRSVSWIETPRHAIDRRVRRDDPDHPAPLPEQTPQDQEEAT